MKEQKGSKKSEQGNTKKGQSVGKSILMVTQIGISMLAPIFRGGVIGYWMDHLSGMNFWFLVFLLLGFLAAFRNVYKLTKPFYAADLAREKQELAYWEELKKERQKNCTATSLNKNDISGEENKSKEGSLNNKDGIFSEEAESLKKEILSDEEKILAKNRLNTAANLADGVAARRARLLLRQEAELLKEEEKGEKKDRQQEAEEEFDAWRKRNGRE